MSLRHQIAIIIPTFNRVNETRNIIQQLLRQDFNQFKIIICDSGSADGTQNLELEFPDIIILNVGPDKWWTGAVNSGIQKAINEGFELLLVLNDDLIIPKDLISRLFEYSNQFPSTIITPVQKELSGQLYAGSIFTGIFKFRENIRKLPDEILQLDCSNGCCLLLPTEIIAVIGLTDEIKIPHVGGDLSIYLRSKNAGYKCIVVPDLLITHTSYTNYSNKFPISTILTHPGSALHFKTYLYLGHTLFNSWIKFVFFGMKNHYIFLKTLIKIVTQLAISRKF
jgi:GT2 family glycosyltransferase